MVWNIPLVSGGQLAQLFSLPVSSRVAGRVGSMRNREGLGAVQALLSSC